MNSINIGKKILSFRHKNNMAISDFSKISNLSPALISQLERGKGNPSLGALNSIANALGISLSDLVKEELSNKSLIIKNNSLYDIIKENDNYNHYDILSNVAYNLSISIHKVEINGNDTYPENIFSDINNEHILFIEKGCIQIIFENEEYILETGDKIIILPNRFYKLHNKTDDISTIIAIKLN